VYRDRANLLGVFIMGGQPVLADEMTNTGRGNLENSCKSPVDIRPLPCRNALSIGVLVRNYFGYGNF